MKKVLAWLFVFGAGVLTGVFLHARTDPREALMQADRDFDQATAANGVEGWVSYFAADGRMYGADGNLIQGHDAVRKLMTPVFSNPKNSLRWAPTFAAISKSGDLGYTTGKSQRRGLDAEGKMTEREGRYITIWRMQKDGSWKVEMDHGSSGPQRPVAE